MKVENVTEKLILRTHLGSGSFGKHKIDASITPRGMKKRKRHHISGNCFNRNRFQIFVFDWDKVTCKKCLKRQNDKR